jgi:GxxExxY protein
MNKSEHPHEDLTEKIIAAAFRVSNTLGCGFLEKVYENAMVVELKHQGLSPAISKGSSAFIRVHPCPIRS